MTPYRETALIPPEPPKNPSLWAKLSAWVDSLDVTSYYEENRWVLAFKDLHGNRVRYSYRDPLDILCLAQQCENAAPGEAVPVYPETRKGERAAWKHLIPPESVPLVAARARRAVPLRKNPERA